MDYKTIIPAEVLAEHLQDDYLVIIDCRFTLGDDVRGTSNYQQAHIPGAVYAHLDNDLCGSIIPGKTGRHPLPDVDWLVDRFSRWGVSSEVQVVAYDDWPGNGIPVAARLWWSLRWLGHEKAAVLDGGWDGWTQAAYPTASGTEEQARAVFVPLQKPELFAGSTLVDNMRQDPASRVVDSRSSDRYRGENETIDTVAGHIPGAISLPYLDNFDASGLFHPASKLRKKFKDILGDIPASDVAFYCGSGVTAAVNVLAMAYAGLGDARLYVGSWSEWITDTRRPVV
jgi:thiosulfate/3-mercaptopyruvate sulfurtransferase